MKKIYKITLGIFIGIFLIISVVALNGYFNYKENLGITGENIGDYNIGDRALNSVTAEEIKDYSGYKDIEGTSNPRIKIRNSTGYEVIALDHNGSIVALGNLTVSDTALKSGGYGFFAYLGYTTSRVIKGFFTDLDVSNNINSSNLTTFNVLINGTNTASLYAILGSGNTSLQMFQAVDNGTFLKIQNWNATNTTYREKYNLTWVGNLNVTGNLIVDVSKFFVDINSGNVGIGTTSPEKTLAVNGTVNIVGSGTEALTLGNNKYILVKNTSGTAGRILGIGADDNIYFGDTDSVAGNLHIRTSGGNRMTVLSGGNVGIGTTSPGSQLEVKNSASNKWAIQATDAGGVALGGIYEETDGSATLLAYDNAGNQDVKLRTDTGNSWLGLSGNVGIGTSSPGYALHIKSASAPLLKLERDGTTASNILFNNTQGQLYVGMSGTENFGIGSNVDLDSSPWFYINSTSGNVGIGVAVPTATLHIRNADPTLKLDDSDGGDQWILRNLAGVFVIRDATDSRNDFAIDGAGKIGINTVTPNQTLDVFGTINAPKITINNTAVMTINQWNATNTTYALNQTLTDIWSDIINVNWNSTGLIRNWNVSGHIQNWNASTYIRNWGYLDTWTANITNYFTKAQWNATNSTYRANYNTTWVGDLNVTGTNYISTDINLTGNMKIGGFINQTVSGTTRYFSNGCTEIANSTGMFWIC